MPLSIPSQKVTVGYWSIRGLAAPLRMMCTYAGADYDDVQYPLLDKEGGGYDASAWFVNDKPSLLQHNALTNLPYIVDGSTVVTQSNACMLYLGRKFKLLGSNDTELIRAEQALCQVFDLRNDTVKIAYGPKDGYEASALAHIEKTVPTHYGKLEAMLKQQGTKYCACDTPTAPDFHLWEMIDQHEAWAKAFGKPSPVEPYPLLKALHAALRADPKLEGYFKSDKYTLPINNKMANFK